MQKMHVPVLLIGLAVGARSGWAEILSYYPFDVDARDRAGSSNGTLMDDAVIQSAVVKYGSGALALDGDKDHVAVDFDSLGIDTEFGDFTAAAWVYVRGDTQNPELTVLHHQTTNGDPGRVFLSVGSSLGDFRPLEFINGTLSRADEPVTPDAWHHLAVTVTNEGEGLVTLYVDGEWANEQVEHSEPATSGLMLIGRHKAIDDGGVDGFIDDVAFFDEALDEDQIQKIMSGDFSDYEVGLRRLWAGDADQDLDFDQLDLVKVQVAAKYLTGQPATWGEGDWNGAPGGEPGSPPVGDGVFDQLDIISALAPGHYLQGPYALIEGQQVRSDGQTSIVYDPSTGEVAVDAPAGIELTSINIDSAVGIFTGDAAANLGGSFDHDADDNLFKATFGSRFGSLSFGNVVQAGLSEDFVANDLTVVGSLAGGGELGNVDLIYIPEPSTLVFTAIGLAGLLAVGGRTCR